MAAIYYLLTDSSIGASVGKGYESFGLMVFVRMLSYLSGHIHTYK